MKRAPFTVHPYKHARYKYVVRGKIAGKWSPKYCSTKIEAEEFARLKNTEILNYGARGAEMSAALRTMALEAQELLAPFGVSILDLARDYAKTETTRRTSARIEQVLEETIQRKKDKSKLYAAQVRIKGGKFAAAFSGRSVADISPLDCQRYIDAMGHKSPDSFNATRAVLVTIFSHAQRFGYCTANPARSIERKASIDNPPGIFKVDEVAFVMKHAPDDLRAFFAIGFFAGLRTSELLRIDWSEVDLDARLIEVPAKKSKTARRRLVKIEPCLEAWLSPLKKEKGPIAPRAIHRHLYTFKRCFPEMRQWPKNVARHSYCSYHLGHFSNPPALALEMGHTSTTKIYAHYRELVRPVEAAKYWQIVPEKEGKLVRAPWENPPYFLGRMKAEHRTPFYIRWYKDGDVKKKFFQDETSARAWMDEKNAPWFAGETLPDADERRAAFSQKGLPKQKHSTYRKAKVIHVVAS